MTSCIVNTIPIVRDGCQASFPFAWQIGFIAIGLLGSFIIRITNKEEETIKKLENTLKDLLCETTFTHKESGQSVRVELPKNAPSNVWGTQARIREMNNLYKELQDILKIATVHDQEQIFHFDQEFNEMKARHAPLVLHKFNERFTLTSMSETWWSDRSKAWMFTWIFVCLIYTWGCFPFSQEGPLVISTLILIELFIVVWNSYWKLLHRIASLFLGLTIFIAEVWGTVEYFDCKNSELPILLTIIEFILLTIFVLLALHVFRKQRKNIKPLEESEPLRGGRPRIQVDNVPTQLFMEVEYLAFIPFIIFALLINN
jgi:hypothetical protein